MSTLGVTSSTSAIASLSRLRHRHELSDDAIENGAYLARPSFPHHTSRKGKERERSTGSFIPGLKIGSKGWVREGFRIFGEHCARNQIRTLLIDCLVMTNLFYPALSIYLQKRAIPHDSSSHFTHNAHYNEDIISGYSNKVHHSIHSFSTPLIDKVFPKPPPLLPELDWDGWWDDTGQGLLTEWLVTHLHDTTPDNDVKIIRVAWADVGEVLDGDSHNEDYGWTEQDLEILNIVRATAEDWENRYAGLEEGCVRQLQIQPAVDEAIPTGDCYILTPNEVEGTVSFKSLDTTNGTGSARLADNGIYRSIGIVFRVPKASASTFGLRWTESLRILTERFDAELCMQKGVDEPYKIAHISGDNGSLQDCHHEDERRKRDSSIPTSVLLLYLLLFTVLGHQLSNATKVHSRFGLAFTGCVQLCCSAVMSFSVLALLGWNGWGWNTGVERSLPTYILPFVIVVVGAENMSTLTKAVFSVPFTHSVPVRIGLGLSKVGSTIAITSFTDLVLLGVIWLSVNLRPVREFCLFAAVVIITDWFMLHTFFLTILSIDAQRLELADVLASNGDATVSPRQAEMKSDGIPASGWKKVLRARTSKSGSLLFILASIGVIYYFTESRKLPVSAARLYGYVPPESTGKILGAPFVTTAMELLGLSPGAKFWRAVNPKGLAHLRLHVPPALFIVLPRLGHPYQPADLRKLSLPTSRLVLPKIKPLIYLLKVLILPQALTAGALYTLLLYLLKDADLLDAQRYRLGRNEQFRPNDEDDQSTTKALKGIQVNLLPCTHESDVDLIASSLDGRVIVSIGIDNTLCRWSLDDSPGKGTRELLKSPLLSKDETIIDVSVSADGRMIAALTLSRQIHQWETLEDGQQSVRDVTSLEEEEPIEISHIMEHNRSEDPFLARPTSPAIVNQDSILVVCQNGSVMMMSEATGKDLIIPAPQAASRTRLLPYLKGDKQEMAILVFNSDEVQLYRCAGKRWRCVDIPASSSARLSAAGLDKDHLVLGYRSGLIEIFDVNGTAIAAFGGANSSHARQTITPYTKKVAVASPTTSQCTTCGLESSDSTFILSSTADKVYVDRMNSKGNLACRCTRRGSTLEDLKFAGTPTITSPVRLIIPPTALRNGFSPGASPKPSPGLIPPPSNGEFPLSYHGTRRLSALHHEASPSMAGLGMSMTQSSPESDMEIFPLGAILTPGGGSSWSICGDRVVGIRRIGNGIDDAQWEVWSLDLRAPWNGSQLVVDAAPMISLLRRAPLAMDSGVRAQRAERLLSLSGRAPFPSLGASFSVETFGPMAYTAIHPYHAVLGCNDMYGSRKSKKVVLGLGNRLGVVTIPQPQVVRRMTSNQGGVGLGIGGLGATPPPSSSMRKDNSDNPKKAL